MAQDRKRRRRDRETEGRRDIGTERRKDGKTEGRRDEGTTDGIVPLPRRLSVSLSLCLSVSLSLCLSVSLRSSQRQRHVLLVVSLSLIVKTRPDLTTARPDLAWAIGLMLTRANILSPRSVSRLPVRFVSPLPVKRNPPRPHLTTW